MLVAWNSFLFAPWSSTTAPWKHGSLCITLYRSPSRRGPCEALDTRADERSMPKYGREPSQSQSGPLVGRAFLIKTSNTMSDNFLLFGNDDHHCFQYHNWTTNVVHIFIMIIVTISMIIMVAVIILRWWHEHLEHRCPVIKGFETGVRTWHAVFAPPLLHGNVVAPTPTLYYNVVAPTGKCICISCTAG